MANMESELVRHLLDRHYDNWRVFWNRLSANEKIYASENIIESLCNPADAAFQLGPYDLAEHEWKRNTVHLRFVANIAEDLIQLRWPSDSADDVPTTMVFQEDVLLLRDRFEQACGANNIHYQFASRDINCYLCRDEDVECNVRFFKHHGAIKIEVHRVSHDRPSFARMADKIADALGARFTGCRDGRATMAPWTLPPDFPPPPRFQVPVEPAVIEPLDL